MHLSGRALNNRGTTRLERTGLRLVPHVLMVGATCAAASCALLGAQEGKPARETRPNIIVVLADDMGWRDVSYQGSPRIKTPNIDKMAESGVLFDYFYAAGPICAPGRYGLLTGRAPFRGGMLSLGKMRPEETTIAKALKTAGYRTAHFGKWHLGNKQSHPLKMGFDVSCYRDNYFDIGDTLELGISKGKSGSKSSDVIEVKGDGSVFAIDLALSWIDKERKAGAIAQPFFAYVAFGSPHVPLIGAKEFRDPYADLGLRADYYAEVSGIDAAIGNLRSGLRTMGLADNTIVWFTSDNAAEKPESNDLSGGKKGDAGVRVVACMEWPARVRTPIRTDSVCVATDIFPTLMDAAGLKISPKPIIDGESLLPLLDGKAQRRGKPAGFLKLLGKNEKNASFDGCDFVKDTRGVWIDGSHKLIVDGGSDTACLYDIYADPAEKNNLSGLLPERVSQMRQALVAWQRSCRESYERKDAR